MMVNWRVSLAASGTFVEPAPGVFPLAAARTPDSWLPYRLSLTSTPASANSASVENPFATPEVNLNDFRVLVGGFLGVAGIKQQL